MTVVSTVHRALSGIVGPALKQTAQEPLRARLRLLVPSVIGKPFHRAERSAPAEFIIDRQMPVTLNDPRDREEALQFGNPLEHAQS